MPAFQCERLPAEPAAQGRGVLVRCLAEAQGGADLGAMVFDGPAPPVIAGPGRNGHADLPGDGLDSDGGHVLGTAREMALSLEQLKQHGKPQPRRAALVAEQGAVGRAQRPAVVSGNGVQSILRGFAARAVFQQPWLPPVASDQARGGVARSAAAKSATVVPNRSRALAAWTPSP